MSVASVLEEMVTVASEPAQTADPSEVPKLVAFTQVKITWPAAPAPPAEVPVEVR